MRLFAVLISLAASAAAQPNPCGDLQRCRFHVRTAGTFQSTGDAAFSDEGVQAMKTGLAAVVDEVLGELGYRTVEARPDAFPLRGRGGDESYSLELEAQGAALSATARSLHRDASVWGQARAAVKPMPRAAWQVASLKAAVREATVAAMADLKVRIDESVGPVERSLKISVRVNDLDRQQRDYVESMLVPCLLRMYRTPKGAAPQSREASGYAEYTLRYVPESAEPRRPLFFHVERIRAAVASAQPECSTAGSPIAGKPPSVSADELNQAVVLSFTRRR